MKARFQAILRGNVLRFVGTGQLAKAAIRLTDILERALS